MYNEEFKTSNVAEFSDIAEQAVEEGTLLPEERVQIEDIATKAGMKKDDDYTKQNAVLMVRGERPEYLYNPQTDRYDHYDGGIPGTAERGIATELSDLEKPMALTIRSLTTEVIKNEIRMRMVER